MTSKEKPIENELKPLSLTDEQLKILFDRYDQKIKESISKKDLEYTNRNIRNAQKITKETIRKCMGKQKEILWQGEDSPPICLKQLISHLLKHIEIDYF